MWRDKILTRALSTLSSWLEQNWDENPTLYACFDVVVPTFRCHVPTLAGITQLTCSCNASVQIIVVVDRPDASSLEGILQLQSYAPNKLVRVVVMPSNQGASAARNMGLAQSFGDYAVLLDDDVFPRPGILDAYIGAAKRHPGAKIFVGMTPQPEPRRLMEQAIAASHMTFFFTVAKEMKHPPWGVTANICVQSRGNNNIWFSSAYPKTGGGEDIDF